MNIMYLNLVKSLKIKVFNLYGSSICFFHISFALKNGNKVSKFTTRKNIRLKFQKTVTNS